MKTQYFGGWKGNRCYTTKTHICEDDDDTPICGAKFASFMSRQIIGVGMWLNHVTCTKCLVRGTAAQRAHDEARRLDATAQAPRVFFFHYNKPASQAAKKPVISVHWQGKCHLCDNVDIRVRTFGRIRPRQPYFIMVGRGVVRIEKGVATITKK